MANGRDGLNGLNGQSAYELALAHGFRGTFVDWLEKLSQPAQRADMEQVVSAISKAILATKDQGPTGDRGPRGEVGSTGEVGERGLIGKAGDSGRDGKDGTKGERGPKGDTGTTGLPPDHEWEGKELRFRRPDGQWGPSVDLEGPKGPQGTAGRRGGGGGGGTLSDSHSPSVSLLNVGTIAAPLATTTLNFGQGVIVVPAAVNVGVLRIGSIIEADYVIRQNIVDAQPTFLYFYLGTSNSVIDAQLANTPNMFGYGAPKTLGLHLRVLITSADTALVTFQRSEDAVASMNQIAGLAGKVSFSANNFLMFYQASTPVLNTDTIALLSQRVRVFA